MDWRGLRREVALVRSDTGLAQGGGTGDKEKGTDVRFISEVESTELVMRGWGRRGQE